MVLGYLHDGNGSCCMIAGMCYQGTAVRVCTTMKSYLPSSRTSIALQEDKKACWNTILLILVLDVLHLSVKTGFICINSPRQLELCKVQ